jgi:hypothetical protein
VDRVARRFFKPFVTSQADFRAASPPEWQVAWADPLSGQQIVLENPPNNVSVVIGLLALSRLIRPSLWSVKSGKRYNLIIRVPKDKAESDNRPGGLRYEWLIIAEVFAKQNHRMFIPVLASGRWAESNPFLVVLKAIVSFCPLTGPAKDFIASNPRAKFQRNRSSMSPTTMCSARSKRELRALQSLQGTP